MPATGAGIVVGRGGRRAWPEQLGARRAVRLLYAVRLAAGPVFVVRAVLSKIGRDQRPGGCWLLTVRSLMLSRVGGFSPSSSTDVALIGVAGQSACASAQQNPASSRATATAKIVERLPRCSARRRQTRCRRCWACQLIAITVAG